MPRQHISLRPQGRADFNFGAPPRNVKAMTISFLKSPKGKSASVNSFDNDVEFTISYTDILNKNYMAYDWSWNGNALVGITYGDGDPIVVNARNRRSEEIHMIMEINFH